MKTISKILLARCILRSVLTNMTVYSTELYLHMYIRVNITGATRILITHIMFGSD